MDLSKLRTSDWVVAVSAIVLLIASFLDWFTVEIEGSEFAPGLSEGGSGWDVGFFWAGIPVLLGLAMLAVVAIRAFSPQTNLPELPWGQVLFGAGLVAAIIVVLKLVIGEDDEGLGAFGVEINRSFGLFLAALAAIGLAVGGFLKWQEERSGAGTAPGSAPPQPF